MIKHNFTARFFSNKLLSKSLQIGANEHYKKKQPSIPSDKPIQTDEKPKDFYSKVYRDILDLDINKKEEYQQQQELNKSLEDERKTAWYCLDQVLCNEPCEKWPMLRKCRQNGGENRDVVGLTIEESYQCILTELVIRNDQLDAGYELLDLIRQKHGAVAAPLLNILLKKVDNFDVKLIKKYNCIPNDDTFIIMFELMVKNGDDKGAVALLKNMKMKKIKFSERLCLSFLSSFLKLRLFDDFHVNIRWLCEDKGMKSKSLLEMAVNGCIKRGEAERALKYYRMFLSLGYEPSQSLMDDLLNSLAPRRDFFEQTKVVLDQMATLGMPPTRQTYHSLLQACSKIGELQGTLNYFGLMYEASRGDPFLLPCTITLTFLLRALAKFTLNQLAQEKKTQTINPELSTAPPDDYPIYASDYVNQDNVIGLMITKKMADEKFKTSEFLDDDKKITWNLKAKPLQAMKVPVLNVSTKFVKRENEECIEEIVKEFYEIEGEQKDEIIDDRGGDENGSDSRVGRVVDKNVTSTETSISSISTSTDSSIINSTDSSNSSDSSISSNILPFQNVTSIAHVPQLASDIHAFATQQQLKFNRSYFNALLSAFSHCLSPEAIKLFFSSMFVKTETSFFTMFDYAFRTEDPHLHERLVEMFESGKWTPNRYPNANLNTRMYAAIIKGYAKCSMLDKAMEWVIKATERGIALSIEKHPDSIRYFYNVCATNNRFDLYKKLEAMFKVKIKYPADKTNELMIKVYGKYHHVERDFRNGHKRDPLISVWKKQEI